MGENGLHTSFKGFAEGLLLEEVEKVEGVREDDEACVFGFLPIEKVFEIGDKVW